MEGCEHRRTAAGEEGGRRGREGRGGIRRPLACFSVSHSGCCVEACPGGFHSLTVQSDEQDASSPWGRVTRSFTQSVCSSIIPVHTIPPPPCSPPSLQQRTVPSRPAEKMEGTLSFEREEARELRP